MALKLFGIEIISDKLVANNPITMDTVDSDASIAIDTTAANGGVGVSNSFMSTMNTLSVEAMTKDENNLIDEYRSLVGIPEVDMCIEEIVQEAIIFPKDGQLAIKLDLSNLDETVYTEKIKATIKNEYEFLYDLLLFNRKGHNIFKKWLVDSRLNYYKNIDLERPELGIQSLQYIDPRKIKKVQESNKIVDNKTSKLVVNNYKEYFYYDDNAKAAGNKDGNNRQSWQQNIYRSTQNAAANSGILTRDSVAYVPSGIVDASGKMVIGYLHKAIKTANNLKLMEDSMLIYRLSRAPERRIFYIDTGNLPKARAEQHVKQIADKYKTKTAYDVNTGKIRQDRAMLAITEDFWLARSNGSGTQIDTLPGGNNAGDTSEVDYFKNKLYQALGVPASRFEDPPPMFNGGTMITRDEVRFARLIEGLRTNFNVLFTELLGTQLILKNIISADDWEEIKNKLTFVYAEDNYFKQALEAEKLSQIAGLIPQFDQFVGKYVSREFVYKKILGMSDDDIQHEIEQMKKEDSMTHEQELQRSSNELKLIQIQQAIEQSSESPPAESETTTSSASQQ